MHKNIPNYYNNLDKVYFKIWDLLCHGSVNRNSSFHLPIFISGHGNKFDGRIVVLRGVDKKNKKIWFHTDIRSKKIKTLKNNSETSFLFYDKDEKIQIRINGDTKINHKNDVTKKSWNKTAHMSRQCYLGKKVPGTYSDIPTSGLSENIDNFKYSIEESEIGYNNFCVIETFIRSFEWLYLAAKGHRRAQIILKNNTAIKKWLIP